MKNQHDYGHIKNNVINLYKKNKAYELIIESVKTLVIKKKLLEKIIKN